MLTLAQFFKQSALPLTESRMLVAQLLQVSRAWMIAHDDYVLSEEQWQQLQAQEQRRLKGEPMAYIVGEREFMGLSFATNPAVLIPRPDTEILVETAQEYLEQVLAARLAIDAGKLDADKGAHSTESLSAESLNAGALDAGPLKVLDMGTGSGAIALSIAHYCPQVQVCASDFSPASLALAQENAQRLTLQNVEFVLSDWFVDIPAQQFDLIVSNPPYIHQDDEHLAQGDLRFEPKHALTDFADGLSAIRKIIAGAPAYLKPGAPLWLEHGWDQAEAVRDLLLKGGFVQVTSRQDLSGIERISGGFLPNA